MDSRNSGVSADPARAGKIGTAVTGAAAVIGAGAQVAVGAEMISNVVDSRDEAVEFARQQVELFTQESTERVNTVLEAQIARFESFAADLEARYVASLEQLGASIDQRLAESEARLSAQIEESARIARATIRDTGHDEQSELLKVAQQAEDELVSQQENVVRAIKEAADAAIESAQDYGRNLRTEIEQKRSDVLNELDARKSDIDQQLQDGLSSIHVAGDQMVANLASGATPGVIVFGADSDSEDTVKLG
ncbi:MAG TPA: hypothetical protein PLY68_07845 [Myxococcota bacterium]|nr:hypothetical protein [Myxococcota bacterium]HOD07061.1 hypothetical protein [Myxococcota bacterium]HPB51219.1 hypothetical protein [Myxococcota bacterium]HQP96090.1 hypothetical protein [Myxococcota bacterium]